MLSKNIAELRSLMLLIAKFSRLSQLAAFGGGGSISRLKELSILLSQFSFEVFGSGLVLDSSRTSRAPVLSK
jgi:hypothetical protein